MRLHWILVSGAIVCLAGRSLTAQTRSDSLSRAVSVPVAYIGSDDEDRLRLDQLRGVATHHGWMLRSTFSLARPLDSARQHTRSTKCELRWAAVRPRTSLTWNSFVPFDRNEGGVWSGRGVTLLVSGGAQAQCGRVRAMIVPELWHARNEPFPVIGAQTTWLSGFASPFYSGREASADLPLRFGSRAVTVVQPGQTAIEADAGRVVAGLGTQSQWWGPGIRNALVMSNHAAGIPSFYVRTDEPLRSLLGAVEARWIIGALSESPYFDFDSVNDLRSLSGLVITLVTAADTNLTIGGARVVYATIPGVGALPARFLDAVGRWGEGGNLRMATNGRAAEQLTTLFARWVFPENGLEAYGEWARVILPASIRSFLLAPHYSQGFTIGAQWVSALTRGEHAWRVQAEASMLEQSRVSRSEEPPAFYVSAVVPQGYTHRGRTIGAAIGPGGSSQFVALDRLSSAWSIGGLLGRIRWNNEQYYRQPTGQLSIAHDVSLFSGVRARRHWGRFEASAEVILEKRLNYLFQSTTGGFFEDRTFDMTSTSLRLGLTPR